MYTQLSEWHRCHGARLAILLYPSDEFGEQELPAAQIPGVAAWHKRVVLAAAELDTYGSRRSRALARRALHGAGMGVGRLGLAVQPRNIYEEVASVADATA